MKNQAQQNTDTLSGIIVLIFSILISAILFSLKYFKVVDLDLEIVLAPFIVVTSLAFGDKLIIFFFLNPIGSISRFIRGQ